MWRRDWTPIILLILVLAVQTSYALECRGTRCRTEECDENGECICKLPDPSTILDGDRLYLGGKLCDEEQVMCDGTNSFWCEHGGRCNEIIQGENYTCDCPPGFIGEHCEHSGAPCGNMFCFHQGECMKEDSLCDCPSNWRGSANCSLPTKIDVLNNTAPSTDATEYTDGGNEWLVPFVSAVIVVGALGIAVSLGKKLYKKRRAGAMKFQQLSHVQVQGFSDDDDDPLTHEPLAWGNGTR